MSEELAAGVWRIDCGRVAVYVIEDGDDVVLVDAGTPWDETPIREGVADAGYALGDVDRVLVTHYDVDHVGALAALAPDLDATVYASRRDGELLLGDRTPSPRNLKALLARVLWTRVVAVPDLPVEFVADGDTVGSFDVFETPGHTRGHLAFVSEDLAVGVLGDLVRGADDGGVEQMPWLFDADRRRATASIRAFAAVTPEFDVPCVGHGPSPATDGSDALQRLADRR